MGLSAEHEMSVGGVWEHLYTFKHEVHLDFGKHMYYIAILESKPYFIYF